MNSKGIRRHFVECSGCRGTKRRPEVYADSLDTLLSDDTDTSRLDILARYKTTFTSAEELEVLHRERLQRGGR